MCVKHPQFLWRGECASRDQGLVIPHLQDKSRHVHSLVGLYLVQELSQLCDLSSQNQVMQDLTQDLLEIDSLCRFHLSRLWLDFLKLRNAKTKHGLQKL